LADGILLERAGLPAVSICTDPFALTARAMADAYGFPGFEYVHTRVPEQLATDIAGTISRTGALIHETISAAVVLSPEHARLFASAGWSKPDIAQSMYDHAVRTGAELAAAGKEAVSSRTRWRLPADHPDALPVALDGPVRVLNSPAAVLVVVAGAGNAGVSAVVETFGPRGGPPPVTRIAPSAATRLP